MSMINNKNKKIRVAISIMLVTGLVAGSVGSVSYAYPVKKNQQEQEVKSGKKEKVQKEETVYVTLHADGTTKEVIVSDWLRNPQAVNQVEDQSDLQGITNTKGEETYTQEGEKLLWDTQGKDIYYQGTSDKELPVGMEIKYSLDGKQMEPKELAGKSGKLKMTIHYTNSSVESRMIKGKEEQIYTPFLLVTGMMLPVENFTNVSVDQGEVLSEGSNTIITCYGAPGLTESIGLNDNDWEGDFKEKAQELEEKITDVVTITADVSNFSMGATYTVATAELFQDMDVDEMDGLDEIREKLDELEASGKQLVTGSKDLKNGLHALEDNFATYKKGMRDANQGAKKLVKGSKSLKKGVSDYTKGTDRLLKGVNQYVDGASTLGNGVKSYVKGTKTLTDGLDKLQGAVESFPAQYQKFGDGVITYMNSAEQILSQDNMTQLVDGTASLKKGIQDVDTGISGLQSGISTINQQVTAFQDVTKSEEVTQTKEALVKLQEQYKNLTEQAKGEEKEEYQKVLSALTVAITYMNQSEQLVDSLQAVTNGKADGDLDANGNMDVAVGLETIHGATDSTAEQGNLYSGAAALNQSIQSMSNYAEQLRAGSAPLREGESAIRNGVNSLATSVNQLATGGQTLAANNKNLDDGASSLVSNAKTIQKNSKKITDNSKTLRTGVKQAAQGVNALFGGTTKLWKATNPLSEGMKKLSDGSGKLHDGMNLFQKEAIVKTSTKVSDLLVDVETNTERLQEIQKASKNYQSFSGLDKGMEGSVKFVLSTEEIKVEE